MSFADYSFCQSHLSLVVPHFVVPCVFVKSSGNLLEAFSLKFDAVVFVETQLNQVVCPKAYVLAEVLFSLVLCVSSVLQSKIAECLSLTKVHQYT
ncbi:hypothetical protein CGI06_25260, partial [Vibrio parahaemolyticus]